MATLKQILKKHGFAEKIGGRVFGPRIGSFVVGKSNMTLDIRYGERNAREAIFRIAGKRSAIQFDPNDGWKHGYKKPTEEQLARFEELVILCKAAALEEHANPAPKKPRKPSPPREKLTDAQKFDNSVWRWLGYFTCVGYVDKEMQKVLYYHKSGKFIRVEDEWNSMAYANIRQSDLDESKLPFTLATFEDWLLAHGVKKKAQKRVKRSFSLYD